MKLLENPRLEALESQIRNGAIDCTYDFKLEIYSMKMIQSDKKQFKTIEGVQNDRQPLSPPDFFLSPGRVSFAPMGHTGRMRHISEPSLSGSDNEEPLYVDSISIRTLFDLRGVLNAVFSDHDFTDVKSNCFSLIPSLQDVIDTVDSRFNSTVNNYSSIRDELWLALEEEMDPKTTKIYGYQGDNIEDPFSEDGVMWSVNFFFYNKARGGLQQHMRIHNNDKPYACNFCNKKFTQKSHVDQHERIHTGAKPFTCQYCGRAFRQRSQQLGHESTHGNQASGSNGNNGANNNNNNNNGNENIQRNAENRVPHDPAPSSSDSSQQFSNLRSMPPQQQLEHCVSTQAVTNLLALSQQHQQLQDNQLHNGVNLNQNGMGLGPMIATSAAASLHMNQMNMNPYSMQHSSLLNHMI